MVQYLMAQLNARHEFEGQGLVEYALIIALVAVLITAALTGLRTSIEGVFTDIGTALGAT